MEADQNAEDNTDYAKSRLDFFLTEVFAENPRFPIPPKTAHDILVPQHFKDAYKYYE